MDEYLTAHEADDDRAVHKADKDRAPDNYLNVHKSEDLNNVLSLLLVEILICTPWAAQPNHNLLMDS